jgi:hypothetical protein
VKRRTPFGLILLSVVSITALVIFVVLRPINHPDFEVPSHARIRNIASIGAALSKYQFDHDGHLPNRLSELVPHYIEPKNISYFFPAGFVDNGTFNSSEAATNSGAIDQNGAFSYLGERGLQQDLILYERSSLWPPDHDATNIMTITSNFTRKLLSAKDVESRISTLNDTNGKQ